MTTIADRAAFKNISCLGTTWPVPATWKQTGEFEHAGPEGILSLRVFDGDLLDPARCEAAASVQPGSWRMTGSINGIGICGAFDDVDTTTSVFINRCDGPREEAWSLPQVQAFYILHRPSDGPRRMVESFLELQAVDAPDPLELDRYGHLAMGPVPVIEDWLTDEYLATLPRGPKGAVLTLIGGGFLFFSDQTECCYLSLQPLPWRAFSMERALAQIGAWSRQSEGVSVSRRPVVWNRPLGTNGCSYRTTSGRDGTTLHGAAWEDMTGQSWHLQYKFTGDHGRRNEQLVEECARSSTT